MSPLSLILHLLTTTITAKYLDSKCPLISWNQCLYRLLEFGCDFLAICLKWCTLSACVSHGIFYLESKMCFKNRTSSVFETEKLKMLLVCCVKCQNASISWWNVGNFKLFWENIRCFYSVKYQYSSGPAQKLSLFQWFWGSETFCFGYSSANLYTVLVFCLNFLNYNQTHQSS